MLNRISVTCVCVLAILCLTTCTKKSGSAGTDTAKDTAAEQVEKVKPAPGKGNVQGKVLYNSKPVENIQVRLCETFSRFLSGCGGKIYTAQTDKSGDYVITNVDPKTYEGLTVRVFDTDTYVFATTGIAGISATKYEVVPDKTLFVNPTHLFKVDLKTVNPKAGSTVSAQDLELKWEAYPDAAYYKFSLYPDDHMVTPQYVNERVEGNSFKVSKPLEKGGYRWKIEAFNGDNRKLSESSDDIKFTIQ